ncbi:MAG: hypothetical protein FJZ64_03205 [Chlamydiae bacterium]|nr:hypothetical protein [Chlamydiota bacterium]
MRKDPPSISSAPRPGPAYDPMDQIVQDLQNIQSFLSFIHDRPHDLEYVEKHLPKILSLRRTINHALDQLAGEPYSYATSRLHALKKENEAIFSYFEGAIGAINPLNIKELKKFVHACEKKISEFDGNLTP